MPSYFALNIHLFLLLLILLIGGCAAYFYYRRTVPPISIGLAFSLGLLRGLNISLILLLLFRPEVTFLWNVTEKKKIALMVDHSASMSLVENGKRRLERALSIQNALSNEMKRLADVSTYAFDTNVSLLSNYVKDTTATGTNITESILDIITQYPDLDDLILLTDGNYTEGRNPLYVDKIKQVQIYPVGIGDTIAPPDLKIINLEYDYIAYNDKPFTVTANVSVLSADTVTVRAFLKQGQRTQQAKKSIGVGDGRIVPFSFTFLPEKLGVQEYEIELLPLNQESVLDNNASTFGIEVQKGKIAVGLIASKPNYDLKFLRQTLTNFEDCKTWFYLSSLHQGSLRQVLQEVDVLFIQNYPATGANPAEIAMLNAAEKPLCYLLSERLDAGKYQFLQYHFPIQSIQLAREAANTQISYQETGKNSPLTDFYENKEQNIRFWSNCPPIAYPFDAVRFSEPMSILLTTHQASGNLPVLATWYHDKLLILGAGFWRWSFLLADNREFADGYDRFIYRIVRWLAGGKGNRNIIFKIAKKIYNAGEVVTLPVQLYDGAYHPIEKGLVTISIVHNGDTSEVVLQNIGQGHYQAEYIPYKAGKYKLLVDAWQNDIPLGRVEAELAVLLTNDEYLYTRQAVHVLKQLAKKTGGHYFSESEAMHLLHILDLSPVKKEEKITLDIWQNLYLLLMIILLFAIEWIVRKRKGLA
jgi:hypothetical protein